MTQGMVIYAIGCAILGIVFISLGDVVLGALVALCGPLWLAIQVNANEEGDDE